MRGECTKIFMFFVAWAQMCCISFVDAQTDENTWVDPDAWSRDHLVLGYSPPANNKCCKCSENVLSDNLDLVASHKETQHTSENSASLIYFKKFVSILFNRKNFKYDSRQQVYKRTIDFIIESSQMEKLEKLQDPRDIDNILTEVFNNVRTPNMHSDAPIPYHISEKATEIKSKIVNLLYDILQLVNISEIRFLLVVVIVIMIAWIIKHRIKIGWMALIFGGIFIYGYLHTYLECNRELEVNEMLEILNRGKGNQQKSKFSHVISYFKGIFYSDDDELTHIRQSAKLSLGFCRPDHVFIMYFNDIFIKYLEVLVEQFAVVLKSLNSNLSFPFNLLSTPIFLCLFVYVIKLIFKYVISPKVWAQFTHAKKTPYSEDTAIKIDTNTQGDRISGDNLKLLLTVMNFTPQRIADMTLLASSVNVSGVEDVREHMETKLGKLLQKRDESPVDKSNVDTNKNSLVESNDVKGEDYLFEDS